MMLRGVKITMACAVIAFLAIALLRAVPAHSYLDMGSASGGVFSPDKWASVPVAVQISTNVAPGAKLHGSASFQSVIQNSLATWAAAPNFADPIGSVTTDNLSAPQNGVNLICFCTSGATFNANDGTLAVTITTTSGTQIIGANIFFNPQPSGVCWATDTSVTSCPNGSDSVQDLQTVATHELGHFIGLDHSGVVRAMMFPFAPARQTQLGWDDVAGVSALYPKPSPDVATGAISGNVNLNGGAVFGAHVFANSVTDANPFQGFPNIRKTPVSILTDTSGNYTIQGVPPDSYVVYAEPLDGPEDNTNVDWASAWGQGAVQTNFTTRWH